MNDLPNALKYSKNILITDGTTMLYRHSETLMLCRIDHGVKLLADWIKGNNLALNIGNTTYMFFPNNNHDIDQLLGIIIDTDLSWHEHIKYCKHKGSSGHMQ